MDFAINGVSELSYSLNTETIKQMQQKRLQEQQEVFDVRDTNQDGVVDAAEQIAYDEKIAEIENSSQNELEDFTKSTQLLEELGLINPRTINQSSTDIRTADILEFYKTTMDIDNQNIPNIQQKDNLDSLQTTTFNIEDITENSIIDNQPDYNEQISEDTTNNNDKIANQESELISSRLLDELGTNVSQEAIEMASQISAANAIEIYAQASQQNNSVSHYILSG